MALTPSYCMDNGKMVRVRMSRNAHVAVTQYRVLSSTVSSALLELQPVTGEGAPFCSGRVPLFCGGGVPLFCSGRPPQCC